MQKAAIAGVVLNLVDGKKAVASDISGTHLPIEIQLSSIANADKGARKSVAILGAGVAGLSAAYELAKLGHKVTLLEGSQRIGGRVWTKKFDSGAYHEYGAMRIPASHDYTRHYIKESSLKLRRFVTAYKEHLNSFFHFRNEVSRIAEAGRNGFYGKAKFELSVEHSLVATGIVPPAILGGVLLREVQSLDVEDIASLFGNRGTLTPRARFLTRTSLRDFLLSRLCGTREELKEALELVGISTGLEVWWDKSAGMFIRDEITRNAEGLEEIENGMDSLPTALAEKCRQLANPVDIKLNHRVSAISANDGGVRILISQLKKDEPPVPEVAIGPQINDSIWCSFDRVICTIPFPVLRDISLQGFSGTKLRAVRNLGYASSTKVLLHCNERFWETKYQIFGGASFSDQITRATYYPSDNTPPLSPSAAFEVPDDRSKRHLPGGSYAPSLSLFQQGRAQAFAAPTEDETTAKAVKAGVIVGSYNWGRDARRMGSVSLSERKQACINVIKKFHPEVETACDDVASIAWDRHPWSRGAFCFFQPGDFELYFRDAIRPEKNVHFAGEHCSLDQGWIQGALISALRAVEEVVRA
tara:strand:- start:28637 stop:30394 length:1758 start_codon:yes stop_codon:yes gene_type:complete